MSGEYQIDDLLEVKYQCADNCRNPKFKNNPDFGQPVLVVFIQRNVSSVALRNQFLQLLSRILISNFQVDHVWANVGSVRLIFVLERHRFSLRIRHCSCFHFTNALALL